MDVIDKKETIQYRSWDKDKYNKNITYGVSTTITYLNQVRHSFDDKPALIEYDDEGKPVLMEWYKYGILHRDTDKPAYITRTRIEYYQNGKVHRQKYPAVIEWSEEKLTECGNEDCEDCANDRCDGNEWEWFYYATHHTNGVKVKTFKMRIECEDYMKHTSTVFDKYQ